MAKVMRLMRDKLIKVVNPNDSSVDCISAEKLFNGKIQVVYSKKKVPASYRMLSFLRDYNTTDTIVVKLEKFIDGISQGYCYAKYNLSERTWFDITELTTIEFHYFNEYGFSIVNSEIKKFSYPSFTLIKSFAVPHTLLRNPSGNSDNLLLSGTTRFIWDVDIGILNLDLDVLLGPTNLKDENNNNLEYGDVLMNDSNVFALNRANNHAYKYNMSGNLIARLPDYNGGFLTGISNNRMIITEERWVSNHYEYYIYIYDLSVSLIKTILQEGSDTNYGGDIVAFDDKLIFGTIDDSKKFTHIYLYDINGNLTEEREIIDSNGQLKNG